MGLSRMPLRSTSCVAQAAGGVKVVVRYADSGAVGSGILDMVVEITKTVNRRFEQTAVSLDRTQYF